MKKCINIIFLCLILLQAHAQEKNMLDEIADSTRHTQKVSGAFKSTRVINAHSTEMLGKGNLDIRILHRFGLINQGIKQLFGLDQASMRMGADYGITNNIMIGLGRSTFRKELDAFTKVRILQQAKGYKAIPVSVLAVVGATIWTEKSFDSIKPTTAKTDTGMALYPLDCCKILTLVKASSSLRKVLRPRPIMILLVIP